LRIADCGLSGQSAIRNLQSAIEKETAMRRTALLILSLALAGGSQAAEEGPVASWSARGDAEEQTFDGTRFVALVPAPAANAGAFSVSVWVKVNDLAGGDATYGRGIARSTRGEQVGDWLLAVHRDGRVRFINWRKVGDDTAGSHITRDPVISTEKWCHIAAVWDGKNNRIFVNGVEGAYTNGQTATGWGAGHEVGRSWTEPGYFWDGLIDDLQVHKRALTDAEVQQAAKSPPRSLVPAQGAVMPAGDPKVSAAIERILLAKLHEQNLQPAPPADDAEFHRRVVLDLAGRIPTRAETEAFLTDTSADRRAKLIDGLLAGKEMPIWWSGVLSGWLMPKEGRRNPQFMGYLRNGLAKNRPWDQMVREMLIARPAGSADQGATAFLGARQAALKDNSIAKDLGRAFFGVNLRCAQCHDHPHIQEWTRERFFGLSAFFARTFVVPPAPQNPQALTFGEKPTGELEYPGPDGKKKVVPMMFLDGKVVAEPSGSRREALARVALDAKSPYFKRAMANRVWRQLMGRGLVEPIDMMHEGNPASHPELLDLLADDFAEHGFDLRRLIAVIMHSDAYARSSRWPGKDGLPKKSLYAVALLKPLDADQLALSLPLATGYYDDQIEGKAKRPLSQVRSLAPWQQLVTEFEPPEDGFEPTAAQALFLLNSDYVQTNLLAKSKLVQSLALADDEALARRLYLSILSRLPAAEETARVSRYLSERGPKARAEACRELAWALLSGAEFRFNH
jgi:hypothetical protein